MRRLLISVALAVVVATPALAHVTLEAPTAAIGADYKAVFRVPHGCSGAATTALRVAVPEGFIAVKPMPKAGWTIAEKSGDYQAPHSLYGTPIKSGVVEVDWSGGTLPDAYYDEFVLFGQFAGDLKAGARIYFPAVQECGGKAERWIMIPETGQSSETLKTPAPSVLLVPPAPGG